MKAFVLADGNFKEFVKLNGRVFDYYPPCHDRMCDAMDAAIPRIGRQRDPESHMVLYPRGTFKTTMVEELQAYAILKTPSILMQYIRGTRDLAADVLFEVRNESLVTPFIERVWGSIDDGDVVKRDSQYALSIGTNKDPTIRCGGVEGSLTGSHMDFAILDDIVDEENFNSRVLSRNIRHVLAWLRPKLNPLHGNKLLLGTLWPKATLYDEIMAENERYEKKYQEAFQAGNLQEANGVRRRIWHITKSGAHNADGSLLFPKLSEEFLSDTRDDPRTAEYYAGWYEMVPCGGVERHFPKESRKWFKGVLYHDPVPHIALTDLGGRVVREIPVDVRMTYDGALTANAGSDFTGITINGVDSDENWWLFSSKKYKEMPHVMTDILCLQLSVYRPIELWAEPGCISAEMMADLQRYILEHDLPTIIKDLKLKKGAGAKEKRINALNARYKRGQIKLQKGPWCKDLAEEMDEWTGSAGDIDHDDGLDSLSMHSGVSNACSISDLSELDESTDPFDKNWTDPSLFEDWKVRPWAGIKIAPGAERSFDGGPSRLAMQMEENSKIMVNMAEIHPSAILEPSRIGGHAGIFSRRKEPT